jgi:hypothetical protein
MSSNFDLARMAYCLMRGKGDLLTAVEVAKSIGAERPEMVLRAAVDFGTTSDPDFAADLADYRTISNGFVEHGRSRSVIDAIAGAALNIPAHVRVNLTTTAMSGTVAAQAAPKPIRKLAFESYNTEPHKAVGQVVISAELERFAAAAAVALLQRELSNAAVAAANGDFLTGIATGIPSANIAAASSDLLADLAAALAIVHYAASCRPFIVLPTTLAVQAAFDERDAFSQMTPSGGSIRGVPVIVSDDTGGNIVVLDASSIALDPGIVTLRTARHAAVQLDDAPSAGAQNLTSLWQTNSIALLAERWFSYKRLRDSAVAIVEVA